jgi:hypothetical protein
LLKKYHIITETNKFNKEKNKAILYKIVSPSAAFDLEARIEFFLTIKGVIDVSLFTISLLVNKITNIPISGIKII